MKYKIVFYTVGRVMLFEAALLMIPLAVSLVFGESCAVAFIISVLIALVPGLALTLLCRGAQKDIFIREGLAIVALSWVCLLYTSPSPRDA